MNKEEIDNDSILYSIILVTEKQTNLSTEISIPEVN